MFFSASHIQDFALIVSVVVIRILARRSGIEVAIGHVDHEIRVFKTWLTLSVWAICW